MAEHSVFSTAPVEPTSHDDAENGSWLAHQFYSDPGTPNLDVVGLRLYVPVGSLFIGKVGKIGVQRRSVADGGLWLRPNDPGTTGLDATASTFSTPLVAGWNNLYLDSSLPMEPGDSIIVGYSIAEGWYYLYNDTLTADIIPDVDGVGFNLAYRGTNPGETVRAMYRGNGVNTGWYGIDIIVSTGDTPVDLTAEFSGSGTLTAAVDSVATISAPFSGGGALSATVVSSYDVAAGFTGSGTFTASAVPVYDVDALFSGSGSLTAVVVKEEVPEITATFSGSGTLTASIQAVYDVTAGFTGVGSFTALVRIVGGGIPNADSLTLVGAVSKVYTLIPDAGQTLNLSGE